MASLRIRTDVLEHLVEARFRSQEQFIRKADISRSGWYQLRDPQKQFVNLRLLAKVLKALDATLADVLAYDPDEELPSDDPDEKAS